MKHTLSRSDTTAHSDDLVAPSPVISDDEQAAYIEQIEDSDATPQERMEALYYWLINEAGGPDDFFNRPEDFLDRRDNVRLYTAIHAIGVRAGVVRPHAATAGHSGAL